MSFNFQFQQRRALDMYIRKKATIIFIPLMMKMSISEADKFIIYAKEKYNVKVSYVDKSLLADINRYSMKASGKLENMVDFILNEFWDGDKFIGDYNEIIPAKGDPYLLDHMIWKAQGLM